MAPFVLYSRNMCSLRKQSVLKLFCRLILEALIHFNSKLGANRLEHLYHDDQQYDRKQHNQIFIAVVSVVNGYFTKTASADDTAHSRIAQNGSNGNGRVWI